MSEDGRTPRTAAIATTTPPPSSPPTSPLPLSQGGKSFKSGQKEEIKFAFRWRRTHSDSALYQKLAAAQQAGGSEQGSPVQDSRHQESDVKPSQELLNSLLLREGDFLPDSKVKEEPGSPHGINGNLENYSPPQLPPSPHSPLSPVSPTLQRPQYLPPSGTSSPSFPNFPPAQQSALEQEFSRFRLDPPPGGHQYQDLGLMGRPQPAQEHNTGLMSKILDSHQSDIHCRPNLTAHTDNAAGHLHPRLLPRLDSGVREGAS